MFFVHHNILVTWILMSLDDLPNLITLSPNLNKNPWVDIRAMGLFIQHCILFNGLPRCMINVLLPFKSLHPNKIVWLEPILNNRLPVIVSPALDTFKASRSSTYFLLVKCLSLVGTVSLFVVASFVSSTAWDQLTTSSPTYMGGYLVGNLLTNLLLLKN